MYHKGGVFVMRLRGVRLTTTGLDILLISVLFKGYALFCSVLFFRGGGGGDTLYFTTTCIESTRIAFLGKM